jgi:TRAP-type C4-dicarboxylate transport system substrate-binding protein
MKANKIIALLLSLVIILALAACGNSGGTTVTNTPDASVSGTDTAGTDAAGTDDAGGGGTTASPDDGKVYTLNFASPDSVDALRPIYLEQPVMDLITEKSNGRIQFTFYPSGSLASTGSILQGCIDGICDMGIDVGSFYTGMFLYTELLDTAGIVTGSTYEEKVENLSAYAEAYTAPEYNKVVHMMSHLPALDFYLISTKALNSISDFNGMSISANPSTAAVYSGLGAVTTNVPPNETYESLRLNVINAAQTGFGLISTFRFYEVANYAYHFPLCSGEYVFLMSSSTYDSLPSDLQAVIDEVCKQIPDFNKDYLDAIEAAVHQDITSSPDFQFADFSDDITAKMAEFCQPIIENKVAELNAAGLDGDGAYALLKSFSE